MMRFKDVFNDEESDLMPAPPESQADLFKRMDADEASDAKAVGMNVDQYRAFLNDAMNPRERAGSLVARYHPEIDAVPEPVRAEAPSTFTQGSPKFTKLAATLGQSGRTLPAPDQAGPLSDERFAEEQARARVGVKEDEKAFPLPPAVQSVPTVSMPKASPESPAVAPVAKMTDTTNTKAEDKKVEAGSGGDDYLDRLSAAQAMIQGLESFGSAVSGKNLRSGMADTLGDRYKQVLALQNKRAEKADELALEKSNNRAQVEYLMRRFPERAKDLEGLLSMTGKPNFSQMLRVEEQVALDSARKKQTDTKTEDIGNNAKYRAGVLHLRQDTADEVKRYHDIQAGLKQAELDLRRAEAERKATGAAEPSEKERNAFLTLMKPAEKTAVSLKDADTLNALSDGMLVTGKPPAFLSRADIAAFNGFPLGETSRSMLAQSNPQAYDLLTKMAELKTMVGHEYFGSALSPSEAERQRQFLDFGVMDSPESIARKMKNYHNTLKDRASVFLRPRLSGRPQGAEWAQSSGLDALSAPGGSFEGLLGPSEKTTTETKAAPVKAPAPVATPAVAPPKEQVERVIMLDPKGVKHAVRADQVEKAKGQGWRLP